MAAKDVKFGRDARELGADDCSKRLHIRQVHHIESRGGSIRILLRPQPQYRRQCRLARTGAGGRGARGRGDRRRPAERADDLAWPTTARID